MFLNHSLLMSVTGEWVPYLCWKESHTSRHFTVALTQDLWKFSPLHHWKKIYPDAPNNSEERTTSTVHSWYLCKKSVFNVFPGDKWLICCPLAPSHPPKESNSLCADCPHTCLLSLANSLLVVLDSLTELTWRWTKHLQDFEHPEAFLIIIEHLYLKILTIQ